jgi:pimeloyl-ACP methyl ester carboxylesterase
VATASTTLLANGLTLSFAEQGDVAGTAVVFLPGPTDSWLSYRQVLDLMPRSLRTVAVSQRGHGDSTKPPDRYRIEDFAADVPLLLDALRIPEAILVGHSGSCLVVRRVAIDNPDRVVGVVLEASPSTLVGDAGLIELITDVVSELEDPIDPDFARSFVTDTSSPDLGPELLEALVHELLKVPAGAWRTMFDALLHYDDRDELAGIAAPSLLIWGDADPIVGRDAQVELLTRMPSATLITYAGVGHTPRWEDPSRFAADVAAFAGVHARG